MFWHGLTGILAGIATWFTVILGMKDESKYGKWLRRIVGSCFAFLMLILAIMVGWDFANTASYRLNIRFDSNDESWYSRYLSPNITYYGKYGKYGYVNAKGDVVIDYIYDDAQELNKYGYAAVKKDGLWGAIDRNSNIVIEPYYNLDNNLKIDFIGKWHLGMDLNMNYYCEK